ncbi:leucine-rich repeat domain-containing protein [Calothrix sp. PCC 7507]|uniref:leucine-rich repeat domain-containing protein n=1 Tax=Calothrix sp. PCC 7507 TaxID=99598 RepID=UPI00029ECDEA|nr:leucine-rich repeat domain-containing protein [Calothrix sp. PCC 7507]AFY34649.1 leucine-rich repeat-containing protein [Calothrix sp. PCC 7507]
MNIFLKAFCISLLLLPLNLLVANSAFATPQNFRTWCLAENPQIQGAIIGQILRVMTGDEDAGVDSKTCNSAHQAILKQTALDLSPVTLIGNRYNDLPTEERVIIDLQPLASLTHLRELNLNDQLLIHDLKPLASLTKLQILSLANNKITDIKPLNKLKQLRKLDLINNQITDLSPLKNLPKLQEVQLSGNPLSSHNCPLRIRSICKF